MIKISKQMFCQVKILYKQMFDEQVFVCKKMENINRTHVRGRTRKMENPGGNSNQ
jgi:hypothetical protein